MKKEIIEAIQELHYLDKKTNLEFEGIDFNKEICECKKELELLNLREKMYLAYTGSVLEMAESLIDSFSNRLIATVEYTNELMKLGEQFDELIDEKITEKVITDSRCLFNNSWSFYIKLQKSEKNLINQSKKELWEKLYPIWLTIISGLYINFLGWMFSSGKIQFTMINSLLTFVGWFFLAIGVYFFIVGFVYGGIKRIFK